MIEERTWQQCVELAEHYIALGQEEVYLYKPENPPWDLVTAAKTGGMTRHGIETGLEFTATHPSGLSFRWLVDLEERDANGRPGLRFDIPRIAAMIENIPLEMRQRVRECLAKGADTASQQGNESLVFAQNLLGQAATLRAFIREPVLEGSGI